MQLLDTHAVGVRREKMYKLDDHIACAVAGITCARSLTAACGRRVAPATPHGSCTCLILHRGAPAASSRPAAGLGSEPRRAAPAHDPPPPRACSGAAADANILINICRLAAQRYNYMYQVRQPPARMP